MLIKNTTTKNISSTSKDVLVIISPISRRRRNLHSFSEELVLLTSVGIYNFAWSSFTFLAAKVGALKNIIPKKNLLKRKSSDARFVLACSCLPRDESDLLHLPGGT